MDHTLRSKFKIHTLNLKCRGGIWYIFIDDSRESSVSTYCSRSAERLWGGGDCEPVWLITIRLVGYQI